MKCPVCTTTDLLMSDRQGIEIDYCPQCRGVWLDRGELDKIVEKATPAVTLQEPAREMRRDDYPEPRREEPRREGYRDDGRRRDDDDEYYRKKKRKGLLGDIFDF